MLLAWLRASATRLPRTRSKDSMPNCSLRSAHVVFSLAGSGPTTVNPISRLSRSFLRFTVAWSVPCAMAVPDTKSWFAMVA